MRAEDSKKLTEYAILNNNIPTTIDRALECVFNQIKEACLDKKYTVSIFHYTPNEMLFLNAKLSELGYSVQKVCTANNEIQWLIVSWE